MTTESCLRGSRRSDQTEPPARVSRVALVHGYLLRGTGSNIYVRNLAQALCGLGVDLVLFSQDRDPARLDFVSEVVEYTDGNPRVIHRQFTPYPGKCRAVRPDIGDTLPVYVRDRYPGFARVLEFPEMSGEELRTYIRGNVCALEREFSDDPPDVILSNHCIMQPAYVARARRGLGRHVALIHGSALNYSVRGNPELAEYALEGLADADALAAPSAHSVSDLFDVLPALRGREVASVPPGVDVNSFAPPDQIPEGAASAKFPAEVLPGCDRETGQAAGRDPSVAARLADACRTAQDPGELEDRLRVLGDSYDAWAPDTDAGERLSGMAADDEVVIYFGKYIRNKGLRILVAALPQILRLRPRARIVAVGFGEDREFLEAGIELLHLGRRELYEEFFLRGDGGDAQRALLGALSDPGYAAGYYGAARGVIRHRFVTTGIMDQDVLGPLVGYADLSVAPSIFPEAFGLVGAEALAAGVLPLLTAGSGFDEVARVYADGFADLLPDVDLRPLAVDDRLVFTLSERVSAALEGLRGLSSCDRRTLAKRAAAIAREHFGWGRAAGDLLRLGRRDDISPHPRG